MGIFDKLFKHEPKPERAYGPAPDPEPVPDDGSDAELVIADIFEVGGRGVVVVGMVNGGAFRRGDKVTILTAGGEIKTTITGIEVERRQCDIAPPYTGAGLLLRGVKRDQIRINDVIKKQGDR